MTEQVQVQRKLPLFPAFRLEAYCELCGISLYAEKLSDFDSKQPTPIYATHLKVCKAAKALQQKASEDA